MNDIISVYFILVLPMRFLCFYVLCAFMRYSCLFPVLCLWALLPELKPMMMMMMMMMIDDIRNATSLLRS